MRPLKPDPTKDPTLTFEKELLDHYQVKQIIGIDEAGRGAIAGPVAVGAHVFTTTCGHFPEGLRDSKLLSEKRRTWLLPKVQEWGKGAVGFGEAKDIDHLGITTVLALTARKLLLQLHENGIDVKQSLILLDGSHDWLTPVLKSSLKIYVKPRADREHATVAGASLRAKVQRDAYMSYISTEHPRYKWESNKGYGSKAHYEAIKLVGVTDLHRKTWINK